MHIRLLPPLAALILLAGCKLIDQRSFFPPSKPGAVELASVVAADAPVLSLRLGAMEPDWHPAIIELVEATLARQPDATFEVVASIAPNADASAQSRAARDIAEAITAQGVQPSRVRLALRTVSGAGMRDILVYVR